MAVQRVTSASVEVEVRAAVNVALPPLEPPECVRLRDGDMPFWSAVISGRARDEWTLCDLVVAAQLTRCQADIEREQQALDLESSIVENAKGTPVMNPRVTVLSGLAYREMALMRSLRMGGVVAGEQRFQIGRRRAEREAELVRDELRGEELLAT